MPRLQDYVWITAVVALGGLSCGVTSRAQPRASALIIVSGDQQTGTVGQELPQALVARVVDVNLAPIPGQIVNFVVTEGGGTVFAGAAISDGNGVAQERWTIGPQAGSQELEARAVDSVTGNAIVFATFRVTAVADAPSSLTVLAGDRQTATPGAPLPISIRVQALDKYGNPVVGQAVQFAPTVGTGSAAPPTATTDSSGDAVTVWTLGPEQGVQRLGVLAGTAGVTLVADACTASATNICVTPAVVGIAECSGQVPTLLSFAWAASAAPAYDLYASDQAGCPWAVSTATNPHTGAIAANIVSGTFLQTGTTAQTVLNLTQITCSGPATVYFCLFPSGVAPGVGAIVATGTLQLDL